MAFDKILQLVILTLTPFMELRASIPAGIAMHYNPIAVFGITVAANIFLIYPIFFFLDHIFPHVEHWSISQKILNRTRERSKKYVDKYGMLGLALFVAIPLPGSGAYSGALAAYILNIPRVKAMHSIALGVLIAGLLVTLASVGFFKFIL